MVGSAPCVANMVRQIESKRTGKMLCESIHLTEKETSMSINRAALAKVLEAKMTGKSFAAIIESIGAMLNFTGASETHITFDYQHDDIEVKPGDLIPFITVGLRQATLSSPKISVEAEETA